MGSGEQGADDDLARRIDGLFRSVYPPDRGRPYSYKQVADAINAEAGATIISAPYLCNLRLGRKDNPSRDKIAGLERFFGTDPGFLTADADDNVVKEGRLQQELMRLLQGLERFFGAPEGFLTKPADDKVVVEGLQVLELYRLLQDKRVRAIATRTARLRSENSLSAIERILDAVTQAEAQDPYTDPSPEEA